MQQQVTQSIYQRIQSAIRIQFGQVEELDEVVQYLSEMTLRYMAEASIQDIQHPSDLAHQMEEVVDLVLNAFEVEFGLITIRWVDGQSHCVRKYDRATLSKNLVMMTGAFQAALMVQTKPALQITTIKQERGMKRAREEGATRPSRHRQNAYRADTGRIFRNGLCHHEWRRCRPPGRGCR